MLGLGAGALLVSMYARNMLKLGQDCVFKYLEDNPIPELSVPISAASTNWLDQLSNRLADWVEHCDIVCGQFTHVNPHPQNRKRPYSVSLEHVDPLC